MSKSASGQPASLAALPSLPLSLPASTRKLQQPHQQPCSASPPAARSSHAAAPLPQLQSCAGDTPRPPEETDSASSSPSSCRTRSAQASSACSVHVADNARPSPVLLRHLRAISCVEPRTGWLSSTARVAYPGPRAVPSMFDIHKRSIHWFCMVPGDLSCLNGPIRHHGFRSQTMRNSLNMNWTWSYCYFFINNRPSTPRKM